MPIAVANNQGIMETACFRSQIESKIHIDDRGDESEILLNREELENYELVQDLGNDNNAGGTKQTVPDRVSDKRTDSHADGRTRHDDGTGYGCPLQFAYV